MGNGANRSDDSPSISADGRFVAFRSSSLILVTGDTNGKDDIFVHDRQTAQKTRISLATDGTQGNGDSETPSISADGRYVAFSSSATNMVPGDTNGANDVFVHDRQTGQTMRVSIGADGAQLPAGGSQPTISADGRYVAFYSPGLGVIVHDGYTGQSSQIGGQSSSRPSISADGRFVAFRSYTQFGEQKTILIHDRQMGVTTPIYLEAVQNMFSPVDPGAPSLSADGRYVAFAANSSTPDPDNPSVMLVEILLHDRQTGLTTQVSTSSDGTPADRSSTRPAISADGNYVAFTSNGTNLVYGDTNSVADVFVRDRQSAATCMYQLTPLEPVFAAAGGSGTVVVTAAGGASCGWTAQSNVPWITVTDGGSGTNDGTVKYNVAATVSSLSRSGKITVAGQDYTVTQTGVPCTYRLLPATRVFAAAGGAGALSVIPAAADCGWTAKASDSWLSITAGGTGMGLGTLSYAVSPNPSSPREGWIRIGATALHLKQSDAAGHAMSTRRVSLSIDGKQGNGSSYNPAISADGRHVAFMSSATNLVPGDTNGHQDGYVRDRATGLTSAASAGNDGSIYGCDWVVISGNGRYAAFMHMNSSANVRDLQAGRTFPTLKNSLYTGNYPAISADGRYVAFEADSSNILPDHPRRRDVFVYDRDTGQTICASRSSAGEYGNLDSSRPSLSGDGRYIAFISDANNLVPGDENYVLDVFVHDRQTGQTTRVSVASNGTEANEQSYYPAISADGRYVAFNSDASNLVPGTSGGYSHVYVHDRHTGQTTRVSVASGGTPAQGSSYYPSISADGRFVTFHSQAANLVPGKTTVLWDVFVHDRLTGKTTRVSVASDGSEGNGDSGNAAISGDGRTVAFQSSASNLDPSDTNGATDVFVCEWQTIGMPLVPDLTTAQGDFNGDSNPDILWRNSATGELLIWYMTGASRIGGASLEAVSDLNWKIVGVADFDSDGKSDIQWRNYATGENYVWFMNGLSQNGGMYLETVADLDWKIVGIGDFNSDGKPDIVWRNSATGENYVWFMDGANQNGGSYLETVADLDWNMVGIADFNGDGKPDILWRNFATGENYVWFMNATNQNGGTYLESVSDLNWRIVAISDLNGDGQADIIWRNEETGENYVWYMKGTARNGGTYLEKVVDLNWLMFDVGEIKRRVIGADFNNDGNPDLLWRNSSTGEIYLWTMDGATRKGGGATVQTVTDQNWQIVGMADFNGDGMPDVLWRNIVSGEIYAWFMDGILQNGGAYLEKVADLNWKIVGTGDFNSDGKSDILWRNTSTGEIYVWIMDGVMRAGGGYLESVTDPNRKIVGTGDFNGDGKIDILWRNTSTGDNYVWYMDSLVRNGGRYLEAVTDQTWQIATTGDFNKDGKVDIIWRNTSTGENYVWYMNGVLRAGGSFLESLTNLNWKMMPRRYW